MERKGQEPFPGARQSSSSRPIFFLSSYSFVFSCQFLSFRCSGRDSSLPYSVPFLVTLMNFHEYWPHPQTAWRHGDCDTEGSSATKSVVRRTETI